MLLCASNKEGKVEPLRPPKDSKPGDLVYFGDLPRDPASDKKCPWEKVCDKLVVNESKIAIYKDETGTYTWHTDKGDITSTSIVPGTIS